MFWGWALIVSLTSIVPCHAKINLGLSHFHGRFDVVHSRAVVNGIRDFNRYVEDIVACLKPGGIALLAEGDWRPYQEDKTVSTLFLHPVGLCVEF